MSITRTAVTDDSGGGTDGTIANNAWLTSLYNAIDAAPTSSVSTITTTGNITALALPSGAGDLVIYLNNAALATIQGIAAGLAGQRLTLFSIGAGQVDLSHQDAAATAALRLINCATSGKTSLAAGVGTAVFVYDATTARWRLVQHEQGAWITRTFGAGNYTASAGTWTVASASRDAYWLRGRTLTYSANVSGTTSTTPVTLHILLPAGLKGAGPDEIAYYVHNNGAGASEGGYANCGVSSTTLDMQRYGNTAFVAGSVVVFGVFTLEVQ